MKPRVLLVAPSALDYEGRPIRKDKLYLPGLTMLSLAAVTPDSVDLTIVQEPIEDVPLDGQWDLVGLTGMGSGLKRAWQLGDQFRARGSKVVIGGIAASLAPAEWTLPHTDALVTGEAELTWPRLIDDFLAGRMQQVYPMTERPDVAQLRVPPYHLMSPGERGLWRPVQATRGCPFPCDFCSIQAYFQRSYRKRPIEHIVRDVRAAKASGSRYISFIDDNIGVDWKFFAALMEALIPENIFWASQCSLHIADKPDMLALAFRSGCRVLSFGIESVNPQSVQSVGKTFNHPSRYAGLLRCVREHGIAVSSEMIVGMEGDTEATFELTYRFLMDNRIPLPRIYILTPVPGTGMYRKFASENRIFNHDLADYNGGKAVYHPVGMDARTLQHQYWKLYDMLYSRAAIARRMWGVPRQTELPMRTFILGTNLHYRRHVHARITPGIV
ncbi:MAG: B12-binding domain-containing radical SAM protein [Gemmatimonadetes bacterium]|nr:B12-binding domain-containing radical SAM protein [Gemmatimonadota bacterium]